MPPPRTRATDRPHAGETAQDDPRERGRPPGSRKNSGSQRFPRGRRTTARWPPKCAASAATPAAAKTGAAAAWVPMLLAMTVATAWTSEAWIVHPISRGSRSGRANARDRRGTGRRRNGSDRDGSKVRGSKEALGGRGASNPVVRASRPPSRRERKGRDPSHVNRTGKARPYAARRLGRPGRGPRSHMKFGITPTPRAIASRGIEDEGPLPGERSAARALSRQGSFRFPFRSWTPYEKEPAVEMAVDGGHGVQVTV